MYEIEYKGEKIQTIHYSELTNEEFEKIREEFYKKPDFEKVKKQFLSLAKGGTKTNEITNYYVKDLMAKVKVDAAKWTIEDIFECKELLGMFKSKTLDNKKIFPDSDSISKKIETAIRLGGKGYARKPTNFPIKTIDNMLEIYNINDNYYDFSCGWGARLLSALKHNVNYYGTDPNYMLTERLLQMAKDYKETIGINTLTDIRTQGSEEFIPEWENKMGLALSSPPYFSLEDYKIGNQSYKTGMEYEDWKKTYLEPTIKNIYKYLIKNGFFILNVKNFKKYDLLNDSIKISIENGFKLVEEHVLNNIKRTKSIGGFMDNSEKILVFKK